MGTIGDEVGRGQKVEAWASVHCSVVETRTDEPGRREQGSKGEQVGR